MQRDCLSAVIYISANCYVKLSSQHPSTTVGQALKLVAGKEMLSVLKIKLHVSIRAKYFPHQHYLYRLFLQ